MKNTLETVLAKLQAMSRGVKNVQANIVNGGQRPLCAEWVLSELEDCIKCLDKTDMPFEQFVVIDWHNSAPCIERFVSKNPITLDEVVRKAEEWDFNEDRDSITFVEPPDTTNTIESDTVADNPTCEDSDKLAAD